MWSIMPHMVQFQSISVQKRGPIFSNSQEISPPPRSPTGRFPGTAGVLCGPKTHRQEVHPLAQNPVSAPVYHDYLVCLQGITNAYLYNSVSKDEYIL